MHYILRNGLYARYVARHVTLSVSRSADGLGNGAQQKLDESMRKKNRVAAVSAKGSIPPTGNQRGVNRCLYWWFVG